MISPISPVSPQAIDRVASQLKTRFDMQKMNKPQDDKSRAEWVDLIKKEEAEFKALDSSSALLNTDNLASLEAHKGHFEYSGNMPLARQHFIYALSLRLARFQIIPMPTYQLINEILQKPHINEDLEKSLLNLKSDEIIHFLKSDLKTLFQVALDFRMLQHSDSNITDLAKNSEIMNGFYNLSIELFEHIYQNTNDEDLRRDANWQLGQLHYNCDRSLHYLKHPNDKKGALATLDRLSTYLNIEGNTVRSLELKAQVANIVAVEIAGDIKKLPKAERKIAWKKCLDLVDKAIFIATREPIDLFLKYNFYHNGASIALHIKDEDTKKYQLLLDQSIEFARSNDHNNYYHAIWYMTKARFHMTKNEKVEAAAAWKKAIEINEKYKSSSKSIVDRINVLTLKFKKKGLL